MPSPTPDVAGFAGAQERKRVLLGVEVTFLFEPTITWPDGAVLDYDGNPRDPTVQPVASAQASATVTAGLVYHMQLSTTRATDSSTDSAGRSDKSHAAVIISETDRPSVWGAVKFIAHGDVFAVTSMKDDEQFGGYTRIMAYGAVEGKE